MESHEEKHSEPSQPPPADEDAPELNGKASDTTDQQVLPTPGEDTSQVEVARVKGTLEFIRVSQTSVQEEDAIPASAHERRNMVLPLRPLSQRPSRVRNLMSFIEPEYFDAPSTSADPNDPTTGTSSIDEQLLAPRRSRLPSARIERNPTFFQSGTSRRSVHPETVNGNEIVVDDNSDADRHIPPPSDAVPAKSCIRNQTRTDKLSVRFNPGGPQVKPYYIENYNPRYKVRRKWRQERARGMRFDSSVPMETRRILAAVADFNPGWAVHKVFDRIDLSDRTTPNLTSHEDTSQDTRARCNSPQAPESSQRTLQTTEYPQTSRTAPAAGSQQTSATRQKSTDNPHDGVCHRLLESGCLTDDPENRTATKSCDSEKQPDNTGTNGKDNGKDVGEAAAEAAEVQDNGKYDVKGGWHNDTRDNEQDDCRNDGQDNAQDYKGVDQTVGQLDGQDLGVNGGKDDWQDDGEDDWQDARRDDDNHVAKAVGQRDSQDNVKYVGQAVGQDKGQDLGLDGGHGDGSDDGEDDFQDAEAEDWQDKVPDDDRDSWQDDIKHDCQGVSLDNGHDHVGQNYGQVEADNNGQDDVQEFDQFVIQINEQDDGQDDGAHVSQDECQGSGLDDGQNYDQDGGQNDADVEVDARRIPRLSRGRRIARSVRKAAIRVGRFFVSCCSGHRS